MPRIAKQTKRTRATTDKARASWRGMLRFGLVTFSVQAVNAHLREESGVAFHQLHAECHRRIRYDKQCPVHGHVDNDEIVSGYEYARGKYIELNPGELDEMRTEKQRGLTIDHFVAPNEVDPIYLDGRMYYLAPDGDEAREPYIVFVHALEHAKRYGVGQITFSGKEQIALIRPHAGVLQMALLNYAAEMRDPENVVGALPAIRSTDRKVRLAEQLIENWSTEEFDFADYQDHYLERVRELIDSKIAGRKVVVPTAEEEPEVINLMDALKKSVRSTRRKAAGSRVQNGAKRSKRKASRSPARHAS